MIKDDMIEMLPQWFQRIKEFPEIMKAYGAEFEELQTNIKQVSDNTHVQTCDVATIDYWEKKLHITPPVGATLEDRRADIMGRMTIGTGYTAKKLYEVLTEMFGQGNFGGSPLPGSNWTLNTNNSNYWIFTIYIFRRNAIKDISTLWFNVAPAHLNLVRHVSATQDIEQGVYVGGAVSHTVIYTAE